MLAEDVKKTRLFAYKQCLSILMYNKYMVWRKFLTSSLHHPSISMVQALHFVMQHFTKVHWRVVSLQNSPCCGIPGLVTWKKETEEVKFKTWLSECIQLFNMFNYVFDLFTLYAVLSWYRNVQDCILFLSLCCNFSKMALAPEASSHISSVHVNASLILFINFAFSLSCQKQISYFPLFSPLACFFFLLCGVSVLVITGYILCQFHSCNIAGSQQYN